MCHYVSFIPYLKEGVLRHGLIKTYLKKINDRINDINGIRMDIALLNDLIGVL